MINTDVFNQLNTTTSAGYQFNNGNPNFVDGNFLFPTTHLNIDNDSETGDLFPCWSIPYLNTNPTTRQGFVFGVVNNLRPRLNLHALNQPLPPPLYISSSETKIYSEPVTGRTYFGLDESISIGTSPQYSNPR